MDSEPDRGSDQFVVRFPAGMRNQVKDMAANSRRSMNAELLYLIEQGKKAVYGETNVAQ